MDANKVFEDIIWADVVIEQDELKAVREFPIKELKHQDLCAFCSWLKIKGVKNSSKYAMLEKIVSVFMFKKRYGKFKDYTEIIITPPRKEPHCPYRLLNILFSDRFSEGLAQLGNVSDRFELDAGK